MHNQSRRNARSAFAAMLIAALFAAAAVAGGPAGTTITYQGLLKDGGSQVDGPTDLEFRLFDQETLGTQVGNTVTLNAVPVSNGLVTVDLDFGVDPYTSAQPLWLDVVVEGQPLSRQQVTSAPFSLGTRGINVDAAGNVGIGTSTPAAKLHVGSGDLRLDSNREIFFADNGQIRSWDNHHRILFLRSQNKMELREFGDLVFSPGDTTGLEKVVMKASGNVGIGTTTPAAKLDAVGVIRSTGSNSTPTSGEGLEMYWHPGTDAGWILPYDRTANQAQDLMINPAGETFVGGPGNVYLVNGGGNVGIGTTNPTTELDVAGTVTATAFVGDGSGLTNLPSGTGGPKGIEEFATPGIFDWVCPSNVTGAIVEMWGAGGGGGGGCNGGTTISTCTAPESGTVNVEVGGSAGGGGGAGGYLRRAVALVPGQQYTIVIGAGGSGGALGVTPQSGQNGALTTFRLLTTTLASVPGGGGGAPGSFNSSCGFAAGGAGGSGSMPSGLGIKRAGAAGGDGTPASSGAGPGGGCYCGMSPTGSGGAGASPPLGSVSPTGSNGGDGGLGETNGNPTVLATSGTAGGHGTIILTTY